MATSFDNTEATLSCSPEHMYTEIGHLYFSFYLISIIVESKMINYYY